MAAPVRRNVRDGFEAVRDAVVELVVVLVLRKYRRRSAGGREGPGAQETNRVGVALRNALGDDLLVAVLVAGVLAVFALHAGALEEELAAEGAEDDGVELLLDELVTVLLVYLLLALANGALSTESAGVIRTLPNVRLDCARQERRHANVSDRFDPRESESWTDQS